MAYRCHEHRHSHPCQPHCCCCNCHTLPCHPELSPPPDPLLQSLVSQLFRNPEIHLNSQYISPTTAAGTTTFNPHSYPHYPHHTQPPKLKQPKQKQCFSRQDDEQFQTHSVLVSLLKRIDNLDSSFRRVSSSSSCNFSLRDVAARTIQTQYRAHLVRRSRDLRNLKELASIKSSLTHLKTSLSRQCHSDLETLSRKAADFLLKIDGIQSGDQTIRDSKRSITQEIVRFLDSIDGVYLNRREHSSKSTKNSRLVRDDKRTRVLGNALNSWEFSQQGMGSKYRDLGINGTKLMEDGEENVELEKLNDVGDGVIASGSICSHNKGILVRQVLRPDVKKHVCFVEDGKLTRVYGSCEDDKEVLINATADLDECIPEDDQGDKEANNDNEESSHSSDDGSDLQRGLSTVRGYEIRGIHPNQIGELLFSAPLPVKMESRTNLKKKMGGQQSVCP
ncbi:hypothetical protein Nepgr_028843 [Nepenthes gracilis]|uniref:BAG family molecular chaperone regulator 8, chloroplastic n=1 Tax=Nepenthes gracilis TaxID=150966 RepID=A0AAD3Y4B1_NEPGR|nr:hypothetical protein Nepgr_028843 [Nepenthes gracilis]